MLELGEGDGDSLEDSEGDGDGERRRVDELDEVEDEGRGDFDHAAVFTTGS